MNSKYSNLIRASILTITTLIYGSTSWAGPAKQMVEPRDVSPEAKAHISESYGKLPMSFEINQGQTDAQVKFLSRGKGYAFYVLPTEGIFALKQGLEKKESFSARSNRNKVSSDSIQSKWTMVRMKLLGASSKSEVIGEEQLPGKSNYFIGNDPKAWHANVPNYAKVRCANVYPGIDVVYYGKQGQMEYDFMVRPGADPRKIQMSWDGIEASKIDAKGDLALSVKGVGEVRHHKPLVYQNVNGTKKMLEGHYVLGENHRVGFEVDSYNQTQPLVIDPTIDYSTYLGGAKWDVGNAIAVDQDGNTYVTGETNSIDFPVLKPLPGQNKLQGAMNAFVTKFNKDGSALLYSTYLGGTGNDKANGIAVDQDGSAYVTGETSGDFPITPGAYQEVFGGGKEDAFVSKIRFDGSALVYSTYLGGASEDDGRAIAIDSDNNVYVTGGTGSGGFGGGKPFPIVNPLPGQNKLQAAGGAFVTMINGDGSALVYSTFLSGSKATLGLGIAVDPDGNAYVTGNTLSKDFPTTAGSIQETTSKPMGVIGVYDAFVTKIWAGGGDFFYSTYLSGSGNDFGWSITADPDGNAYVTGATNSKDFPGTLKSGIVPLLGESKIQKEMAVGPDVFVTKINPDGNSLVYFTFLGGSGTDGGCGIAIDASRNAYVTGEAGNHLPPFPGVQPIPFPTVNPIPGQGLVKGQSDAFVAKINPDASALVYSTLLGGSGIDIGDGIAVDGDGNVYVTGYTAADNFPVTPGAYQKVFGGFLDAFVTKIKP